MDYENRLQERVVRMGADLEDAWDAVDEARALVAESRAEVARLRRELDAAVALIVTLQREAGA